MIMNSISLPWMARVKDGDGVGVTIEVTQGAPISFYHRTNISLDGSTHLYTFPTDGLEAGWSFAVRCDLLEKC